MPVVEVGDAGLSRVPSSRHLPLIRTLGRVFSFGLASSAAFAVTFHSFAESFHSARLTAVVFIIFLLHLFSIPKFVLNREAVLYVCFLVYMALTLLWTDDVRLAMNTIVPAVTFVLLVLLFGSLCKYHNLNTILFGTVCGVTVGAVSYTVLEGFPFSYPADFSYNAIAGIYLFGLYISLFAACHLRTQRALVFVAVGFLMLTVATTSIKVNVGILLGVLTACVAYSRFFVRILARNVLPLLVFFAVVGFMVLSNEGLLDSLQDGLDRVALGIEILQVRENVPGYSAFEDRTQWMMDGLKGWAKNPLFGHGAEAFRNRYGITSHSTPIDLLYNFGLVGLALFYSIIIALATRLLRVNERVLSSYAVVLGALVCYFFISASAPLYYNSFFAMFVGVSSSVLAFSPGGQRASDA